MSWSKCLIWAIRFNRRARDCGFVFKRKGTQRYSQRNAKVLLRVPLRDPLRPLRLTFQPADSKLTCDFGPLDFRL
jgi:hypothetical protein